MNLQSIANLVSIVTGVLGIVLTAVIPAVKYLLKKPEYITRILLISNIFLLITAVALVYSLWSVSNSGNKVVCCAPPLSSITHLMDQDVLVAKTGDVQLVEHIYAPGAEVIDAGCYSHPGTLTLYQGLAEIRNRYQHLPHFNALEHVNISVTWIPDPQQPMEATATAETVGVYISAGNSSQISQPLVGNESWSFVRINDQWFISKFIFNLCLPS